MKRLIIIIGSLCWAGGVSAADLHAAPEARLNFKLSPAQIKSQCDAALQSADQAFQKLVALSDAERTFDNTVWQFDQILGDLSTATTEPIFLKYVSPDKTVRDAGGTCETKVEQYKVGIFLREDLFKALKSFADTKPRLEGESARLLDKTILDFKQNGMLLPTDKREQVKKWQQQLVDLESAFDKNISEYQDPLWVTEEDLEGLPADYIQGLKKNEQGLSRVTLDYPDYFPFMQNAKSEKARKALEYKFDNRAAEKNVPILEEALRLRTQVAHLLGYPNHAAYRLENRMAKNPQTVEHFLKSLSPKFRAKAKKELAVLLAAKLEDDPKADRMNLWDWRYYDNKLRKTLYHLDDQKIKEYFPFQRVLDGMFQVYQQLLGVRFKELQEGPRWVPEVKLFEVRDASDDHLIAYFYMDLFPRAGKYKHMAAFPLIEGRQLPDGSYVKPVASIVGNFSKPVGGRPALLTHDETETLFHEFGHIMHDVLTQAKYDRFSGTSVARDFVEAPSQMLENWVWEPQVLKMISGHYKTGEPLPDDLIQQMIAARTFDSGIIYSRQLFFATMDMTYHLKENLDTTATYAKLMKEITSFEIQSGTHSQASFGHIMGGYDAGYYGYLWSKVYAEDMFSRFKREGILNPKVGMEYRKNILEVGGGQEEEKDLEKFLGRKPNEKAFLERIGIR